MAAYLNIPLDTNAAKTWSSFKLNKLKDSEGNQVQWLVFRFDCPKQPKSVQIDAQGSGSFVDFCATIPEKEARYAIYNLNYQKNGAERQKVALLVWAPLASPVKERMLTASNKDALKLQLDGIHMEIQCGNKSELELKSWIERAQNTLK